jgi:diguanylate cyclase (GGDEF)-like protein/PAS domain S-box-containing protein
LRRRWHRAFAIMLALTVGGAVVSSLVVTHLVGTSRTAAEEVEVEADLTARLRQALDKQDGLGHTLLDHGRGAAPDFLAADANTGAVLDEAVRMFNEPAERSLVSEIRRQWDETFTPLRPRDDGALGVTTGAEHLAVVPLHTELSQRMRAMKENLDKLATTFLEPISESLAKGKRAERQLLILLYALLAGSVGVGMYFTRRARRDILLPIRQFQEAAHHVAAGRFDHRVVLDRDDEYGELAATFNAMAAAVDAQQRQLVDELYGRARLAAIVESSDQAILGLTPDLVITSWNPGAERLYGYTAAEAVGRTIDVLLPPLRVPGRSILHRVAAGERFSGHETEARSKDGRIIRVSLAASPIVDADGTVVGISSIAEDISERKALEERLHHQAFHDPLTNLANRALLKDRLKHALARQARSDGLLGVVLLDLDDFKSINDSLGHRAGDELLVSVADRLRRCVREADTLARLGGDEFAILLEDLRHPEDVIEIAERIVEALSTRFTYEGRDFPVSASVGISLAQPGSATIDDVIRDADVAMYLTKSTAKGTFTVFEPGMHFAVKQRLQLKADLAKALGTDELSLHYQPIIDLPSGEIVGVEALARWQHPERGMVPPAEFIPVAEDSGIIVPLGLWVLETACRQVKHWQEAFETSPGLRISVNVSGRQLEDPRFVGHVGDVLATTGFDPSRLVLEITETVLVTKAEESLEQLRQLKRLGVQLAIDDFGTGYSSLSSLQQLPVDILKVDRSFVARLDGDDEQAVVARAVLSLGRTLQLQTVAEGVESPSQADELRKLDCNMAQGYFFARPADAIGVTALLQDGIVPLISR